MAYCRIIPGACIVTCSAVPLYGGDQFVAGAQAGMQYPVRGFVALFPNSGFTVPGYCPPPQPPGQWTPPVAPPTASPPAQSAPPPPPPASGPPRETAPPKPPITGEPRPPKDGCGPAMAVPSISADTGGDFNSRYGHSHEDGLRMPAVGQFVAFGQYASATPGQGDTIVDAERPLYTQQPIIDYDEQGKIETFKPGTGSGYYMFGPMELQPAQFYGDNTNHSPRPGVTLPKSISKASLAVLSFVRNNTGHGDSPSGFIGWGVPHPTGLYVADGWIGHLGGAAGARNLIFYATDYSGALDSSCSKKMIIGNALEVTCGLTVNGDLTVVGSAPDGMTEDTLSSVGAGLSSFTAITLPAESAFLRYEVLGWNATDGETIAAEGMLSCEAGELLVTHRNTLSHAGGVAVAVSGGFATVSVTNVRTASDNTCWTLRYKLSTRDGSC